MTVTTAADNGDFTVFFPGPTYLAGLHSHHSSASLRQTQPPVNRSIGNVFLAQHFVKGIPHIALRLWNFPCSQHHYALHRIQSWPLPINYQSLVSRAKDFSVEGSPTAGKLPSIGIQAAYHKITYEYPSNGGLVECGMWNVECVERGMWDA